VQFSERLGYRPFPGTLNVKVEPPLLTKLSVVRHWEGVRIDGFQASGRTFGGATCHAALLSGHACHLITPDRSHYRDVVEFIAVEYLRDALKLHDNDSVSVELAEA
jgi:riboflavin kinase